MESQEKYLIPTPGQFYVQKTERGTLVPLAFIVESNQYAVIFTNSVRESLEDDNVEFDWDRGVRIMSIATFNELLRNGRNLLAKVSDKDSEDALKGYNKAKTDKALSRLYKNTLPTDEHDYRELIEWEKLVKKGIYPPPAEYRDIPGAHWFYSGISDTQFVILFWSPAQQNYVMANGEPDPKALTMLRDGSYYGPVVDNEPVPEGKEWDHVERVFVAK